MGRLPAILIVLASLTSVPALAGPCKTQGTADASMAFPTNQAADVTLARSMVPVMLPDMSGAAPKSLFCTRMTLSTPAGDYALGGEDGDPFPRVAVPVKGKKGPTVYVAASPAASGTYALVVHGQGGRTIVKRFYAAIPTDQRLAEDVSAALANEDGIMAFDAERRMVAYLFPPPRGVVPPPVESGPLAHAGMSGAGPQIFVLASGDLKLLDVGAGMKHKPSGFACPQTFEGLPVLLMSIDPRSTYLNCNYREGTDLRYREDDKVRYQLALFQAAGKTTPSSIFETIIASDRQTLHIQGDRTPPLATGPAPSPQLVAYWDTDGGVSGLWVGKAGRWIVVVRSRYRASAANDAEAGKIAQILFAEAAKQLK